MTSVISYSPRADGCEVAGDLDDVVVVEVEAGDREVARRVRRLLLERQRATVGVELDDAVARRVGDPVGEDRRRRRSRRSAAAGRRDPGRRRCCRPARGRPSRVPMKSAPRTNACASPFGSACTAYSMLMPNWEPSPSRRLELLGVVRGGDHQDVAGCRPGSGWRAGSRSSACRRPGRSCLLTPRVMGCSRVPEPPARIIPRMTRQSAVPASRCGSNVARRTWTPGRNAAPSGRSSCRQRLLTVLPVQPRGAPLRRTSGTRRLRVQRRCRQGPRWCSVSAAPAMEGSSTIRLERVRHRDLKGGARRAVLEEMAARARVRRRSTGRCSAASRQEEGRCNR